MLHTSHRRFWNKPCTIITTEASRSICDIHNRMPVILMPEFYEKWLNTEVKDQKELRVILQDGLIGERRF